MQIIAQIGDFSKKDQLSNYREASRGVVLNDDGRVFIMHLDSIGLYKLPGGGLDPGETPEQAMVRECSEELGMDVEIIEKLGTVEECRIKGDEFQVSYCYVAKVVGEPYEQTLEEKELQLGHHITECENIDEAISKLENCYTEMLGNVEGNLQIKERDTAILRTAKEFLNSN